MSRLKLAARAAVVVIALASCGGGGARVRLLPAGTTTSAAVQTTTTDAPHPPPTHASRSRSTVATALEGGARAAGDNWWRLALCESGGKNEATGNGFYGYFQFDLSTWASNGGTGLPTDHSYEEQLAIAQVLFSRRGRAPWPVCGRYL